MTKKGYMNKLFLVMIIALSGCASTRDNFYKNKYAIGDTSLCRSYFNEISGKDANYLSNLRDEIDRRHISPDDCRIIIGNANTAASNVLIDSLNTANANNQRQQQQPQQGMLYFLSSDQVNGSLRYCKYSNGAIQTVGSVYFCPQSIRQ
jgi:hypothetical protein